MEAKTLTINKREQMKKSANKKLRKEGKIPAVIYGHNAPVPIVVDNKEFNTKFKVISENTIINLELGKKKHDVLVKDYQEDIISGELLHIDFYEIEQGKLLKTYVPIHLEGLSPGVKEGGIMEHFLHDIEIECLPSDLPDTITLDISELEIGDSIHVSDLPKLEGVKFLTASDQVVCVVTHQKEEVTTTVEDALGEEADLEAEEGEGAEEGSEQG